MTLQIDIPPDLEAQLAAEARAADTSPEQFLRTVLERELAARKQRAVKPFRTLSRRPREVRTWTIGC